MPNGFLGAFRSLEFDPIKYQRFVRLLRSIENQGETINSRLIAVVWFIPIFMEWNHERVIEKGANRLAVRRAVSEVTSILEEKLGLP